MPEISDLLEHEARSVDPSDLWVNGTLEKVRRRRRVRQVVTTVLALTLATAGFLVAVRTFTGTTPSQPASNGAPNYQMSARMLQPGEPVPDAAGVQGENFIWISVDVTWDPENPPGVHRCTWKMLDANGTTVSRRTQYYLPRLLARGRESYYLKMLDLTGEPAGVSAECEPERLDRPGITDLQPPPETSEWDATLAEFDARVEAWADGFGIQEMSTDQLAGNLWAVRNAIILAPEGNGDWLQVRELSMRLHALCVLLPPEHEFRGGEFCD
jgi:hypothetical protein